MRILIASLIAISGAVATAHGQGVMRMLVSTDGVNFQSSVNASPGQHIDVLVTASYTGTLTSVAGFGSANFQPTVSHWNDGLHPDQLDPILQGGNTLGSLINAQTSGLGLGSPNPYLNPTPGVNGGARVPAAPYSPGTYGRVYPMGRSYINDGFGGPFVGFVHHNPDGSGLTYLRIAQSHLTDWFNPDTNDGGGGIDAAQLYTFGRTSSDPDFWGNHDVTYDPGDPNEGTEPGYVTSARIPANDSRLQNVQLFRFGIDLSTDAAARTLVVDAPIPGQQVDPFVGPYMSFFVNPFQPTGTLRIPFSPGHASIVTGAINVIPSPGALGVVGVGSLLAARRRRA
jgi:hypothetical protein